MFEIPDELVRVSVRLEHSNFEFEICFGFRVFDENLRKKQNFQTLVARMNTDTGNSQNQPEPKLQISRSLFLLSDPCSSVVYYF